MAWRLAADCRRLMGYCVRGAAIACHDSCLFVLMELRCHFVALWDFALHRILQPLHKGGQGGAKGDEIPSWHAEGRWAPRYFAPPLWAVNGKWHAFPTAVRGWPTAGSWAHQMLRDRPVVFCCCSSETQSFLSWGECCVEGGPPATVLQSIVLCGCVCGRVQMSLTLLAVSYFALQPPPPLFFARDRRPGGGGGELTRQPMKHSIAAAVNSRQYSVLFCTAMIVYLCPGGIRKRSIRRFIPLREDATAPLSPGKNDVPRPLGSSERAPYLSHFFEIAPLQPQPGGGPLSHGFSLQKAHTYEHPPVPTGTLPQP